MPKFDKESQVSSKKSFESSVNAHHKHEESTLQSKFDFLSKNIRIFCAITKHLTDIRARNMKVLEKLTEFPHRKFAFAQLAMQTNICLGLMLELYAMVKDPKVCLLLLEMSTLIQQKMSILDEFLAGIDTYDKGLEKAYLKDIIEYFDSIKEPQIIQITLEINRVKTNLETQSRSCQQKSQYDTIAFSKIARPFFRLQRLAFEKIIQVKRGSSTNGVGEKATRKQGEQQVNAKQSDSNSSTQTKTTTCQTKLKLKKDIKSDHAKNDIAEYDEMKENKNAESNRMLEKVEQLSDILDNKQESSNINCKPTYIKNDKQITSHVVHKNLSVNSTIHINSNNLLKSSCTDKNMTYAKSLNRENPTDLVHQKNNKRPILHQQENKNERTIRFAKLFCSRSIKSSSKAGNLKQFQNAIENNMHNVLPMLNDDQGFKSSIERKRKRSIDTDVGMLSALNSAALGSERKRLKYDV